MPFYGGTGAWIKRESPAYSNRTQFAVPDPTDPTYVVGVGTAPLTQSVYMVGTEPGTMYVGPSHTTAYNSSLDPSSVYMINLRCLAQRVEGTVSTDSATWNLDASYVVDSGGTISLIGSAGTRQAYGGGTAWTFEPYLGVSGTTFYYRFIQNAGTVRWTLWSDVMQMDNSGTADGHIDAP